MTDTKHKSYKLNETAIVTAIDASNPTARGSVWTPVRRDHIAEATALANVGYATVTTEAATVNIAGEPAPAKLSGEVDAVEQADGTYRNKAGVQVNQDGSAYDPLVGILDGTVDEVVDALESLDADELVAIRDMEIAGKNRKGVIDAIAEYDVE